ncbi:MAG TPA: UV DNA damage repair endonuclease UvsE [Victivallales bacterium]|nr:UV DNA damage repair endonuclease UvsE [Victivallales bacterium]
MPQNKKSSSLSFRLGLCCIFIDEAVKFRIAYASNLRKFDKKQGIAQISEICLSNSKNLLAALKTLKRLKIGAFRVNSQFFPLYTHPEVGYQLKDLNDREEIESILSDCRTFARDNDIRLSFHPDQFVIISSPREDVVKSSIAELEYQSSLSEMIGAEVVNIHVGGRYEGKKETFLRFRKNFKRLSSFARSLITIENDDIIYTPSDVEELASSIGIPFVYDIHHHRCNRDSLSEKKATELCVKSWKRFRPGQEPYFHISSSRSPGAREHSDYIDVKDFPDFWKDIHATIDVEAKAKNLAVAKLMRDLGA